MYSSSQFALFYFRFLKGEIPRDLQVSNSKVSLRAHSVDCEALHKQSIHVVAGRDALQVALSQAVLLVTGQPCRGSLDVIHAFPEADGKGADLELGIEASLILVQVLFFVFVEELILHVQELAPGPEELVPRVIIR